jgi:Trypsin-co-occurring domain 1
MPARILVELPGGNKVLFGGSGPMAGLAEVGVADGAAKVAGDKFKAALGALTGLVATLEESVGQMPRRPNKVELEFGASLTGDCDLWIVSGTGAAEFKVTLAWEGKS